MVRCGGVMKVGKEEEREERRRGRGGEGVRRGGGGKGVGGGGAGVRRMARREWRMSLRMEERLGKSS